MEALLRQIRSVLWSLLGVRRGRDSARDLEGVRPVTLIVIAIVIVALIVLGLVSLARLIGGGAAPHASQDPTLRDAPRAADIALVVASPVAVPRVRG